MRKENEEADGALICRRRCNCNPEREYNGNSDNE